VRLTPREVQVLECRAKGLTNEQVAEELDISMNTLATHAKHIALKTGCKNAFQLGMFAERYLSKGQGVCMPSQPAGRPGARSVCQ
jgi:two-component system, NarL family, nitrate/nitrite response regulator NarL